MCRLEVVTIPYILNPTPQINIMSFISEAIIDQWVEKVGGDSNRLTEEVKSFHAEQPVLVGYFFSDDFKVFKNEEKDFAIFLAVVIWKSISSVVENIPQIDEETFANAEEYNWGLLQNVTAKKFRDRLDVFFEDSDQEDLLAFVEDAIIDDEDQVITLEVREPLFVLLKTIIDCLLNKHQTPEAGV